MQQTGRIKRNLFSMSLNTSSIRHKAKSVRKVEALGKERLSKMESLHFYWDLFIRKDEHACSGRG